MDRESTRVDEKICVAPQSNKETETPVSTQKENDEPMVREYYEAESWQFSGCGD